MRHGLALLLAATLAASSPALAADGDYDTSFSTDGVVTWTDGGDVAVTDVAVGDGVAFAVGSIELPGENPALHFKGFGRSGGATDQGCAQVSETLFPLASGGSGGNAALLDSSGGLVIGGWAAFLGTEATHRALISRFTLDFPGCVLDDDFSGNGWTIFDDQTWCDTENCEVVDLVEIRPATGAVLAPRLVALVRSETTAITARFFLLGLTGAGAIDTPFGNNGWREVTIAGLGVLHDEADLAVDGRGGLHVLVTRYDPDGNFDRDVYALSYFANGDLVAPGNPLFPIADPGNDDGDDSIGADLAFAHDDTWLISFRADDNLVVVQTYNPDGSGSSFGSTTLPFQLAAQGDGKLVGAFDFAGEGFATERRIRNELLPLDLPYGGGTGRRPYDIDLGGTNAESVAELALWGGRPLIAGTAAHATGTAGFLLRAVNAYLFADSFEVGTAVHWSAATGLSFPE